jgi:hypothetical protein
MRSSKTLRAILGLSLGVTLWASTAQAQPEDKRTFFTFSGPVALPGMTLPAGRYIFHIVDTTTSRKVIQVMSDDGKKPFVMANTIPDQRRDAPKDATVSFYETPRGTPAAVKTWWYPGETTGYQFIYPRAQAKEIAHNTGKPVLTTKSESSKTEETKSAELTRIDANGKDSDVNAPDAAASVAANNNNNANANSGFRDQSANSTVFNRNTPAVSDNSQSQVAQNNQNANQRDQFPAERSRTARNELPKTGSELPFVALIGMISALGFVTARFGTSFKF